MTVGNTNAYDVGNGGSRMILVEMDDVNTLPTTLVDNGYKINSSSESLTTTNATQLSYTTMNQPEDTFDPNVQYDYRPAYAAKDPGTLKYVTLDCSKEVTITNNVNLSLTRPGVVTTHYLVPMNYNTNVTGSPQYLGTSYDSGSKEYTDLADALDGSDGVVPDNLIAEYGMGYNDAQSVGLGPSIEIDLFEMTPCAMATTLHGAEFDDNGISQTDTNGVFCNVHGANANTLYPIDNAAQTVYQFPSKVPTGDTGDTGPAETKYVTYTYIKNGTPVENNDQAVDKYGPGDAFGINTLKNIEITNTIKGYASSDMPSIVEEATGQSQDDYINEQGWMQMTTTLTQGSSSISMTVLSQGFPPGSGVENVNYIVSLWMRDNNYWLDGQEPDDDGNGEGVVRGWVDYVATNSTETNKGSTVDASLIPLIISQDIYDALNPVYKTTDGYSSIAIMTDKGPASLSSINPSICLFGKMSITSDTLVSGKTYGVSMDVTFRSIDDALGYPGVNWSGQYAISFGVHYASGDTSIDIFGGETGATVDTPSALTTLVNVPPVTYQENANNAAVGLTINTNYQTAMNINPYDSPSFQYSPDPGSYLTGTSQTIPEATDNDKGIFAIPPNQPVYMSTNGMLTGDTGDTGYSTIPTFLSEVMPADGTNYIVFK